jgi:hypothetical protein
MGKCPTTLGLMYAASLHFCKGNNCYASTALVQKYNQSIAYIRSSSNVFGFMQLSHRTKLVYCLDLLGGQVHKSRYIGACIQVVAFCKRLFPGLEPMTS